MTATEPGACWAQAGRVDRVDEHRGSTDWVRGLWYAEDAHLIKLTDDARLATNADGTRLRTTRPFVEFDDQRHVLIGLVEGEPWFAVRALVDEPLHSLRDVGHLLDPVELELATATCAILAWHRSAGHCPTCGSATTVINGGFARHCPRCDRELFPRTDPAVIVAVVDDDDRLLLARSSVWRTDTRVSVLAGFVEAGESFEHAVHREIGEEVDVPLGELVYFGSQPWPFPRSVMIGFFARATSTTISIDGEEIVFADWFTRDELDRALASGELGLPMASSIAHRLITAWREQRHPFATA